MKSKRWISFLLTVILAISMTLPSYAAEMPCRIVRITLTNDSQQTVTEIPRSAVTVDIQVEGSISGVLYLAAYGDNGQALSVQQKQNAAGGAKFFLDNRNGAIKELKAFLLSDDFVPLANACSFTEQAASASEPVRPLTFSRELSSIQPVSGIEPYSNHWYAAGGIPTIDADLSDAPALAYSLTISNQTRFSGKTPEGYDPGALLEWGKYPGLNVDLLQKHGFTGKGAVVAYIDQPIANHEQYAGVALHYTNNTDSNQSMHGPAVLSLLAGKDTGTAPEAEVYYYAHASWLADQTTHAACLYQIIEQNKSLPEGQRITMVGFSDNIDESEKNADAFRDAVTACEKAGIMVWFCGEYGAGSFLPMSDKNDPRNLVPEEWWGSGHRPKLVMVPAAGRTTAATMGGASYIYWASGGLSWTMPYMLGLYAIATEIDPSLTQDQLRELLVNTAYEGSGLPTVNPVGFVAAVLDGVGRNDEAAALRRELAERTRYIYAVMDAARMSAEDLSAVGGYLASITDAQVLTVDASAFATAKELYSAMRTDAAGRDGTLAGIQIFGTPDMVPSFQVDYKVRMGNGEIDNGGSFLSDLFYGSFQNDSAVIANGYNVMDHFEQGWNIDLVPQWPVARLPLSRGEFSSFFSKYHQFVQNTGLNRRDLVNFSNPIFPSTNHIDDMGCFLNRMANEFRLLDVPYRLYGNQVGQYPVTTAVLGDFTKENLSEENRRAVVEILINSHGQRDNIDQCVYVNGEEQRFSLINTETINTVLADNAYYLDCWTCLNGYGMEKNLTTAALNGNCVGAFSATSIISNNGVNCNSDLEEMKKSNFYYFYYSYFKALHEGQTRSRAFLCAQQAYAQALIADSAYDIRGEGNYQFNLCNLLAYHNFGVLEPSVAWAAFDAAGYITKDQDTPGPGVSSDFLTGGVPVSGQSLLCRYTVNDSQLESGEVSIQNCTVQGLDNGYVRYSLAYSAPAGMRICVFDPPDGDRYKLLSTSVISGGQGVLQFDLKPEDVIGNAIVVSFFYSDADRFFVSIRPTIPLWVSDGNETGAAWNHPAFSTASSFAEGDCAVLNLTAKDLDNGCIRFVLDYIVPQGLLTSIFSPPQGDRFMQLTGSRTSGEQARLVFDLPRSEVEGQAFTIKFYRNEEYFYVFIQDISQ